MADLKGRLTLNVAGVDYAGDVTLTPVAAPVPEPPPPPPPTPIPTPTPSPGTWPSSAGIALAGDLKPAAGSEPNPPNVVAPLPTVLTRPAPGQRVSDPRYQNVAVRALPTGWAPDYPQLAVDSPDGKLLLLVKPDNGYQVFDRATLAKVGAALNVEAPRWMPDGRIAYVAGSPYRLVAVDPRTGATSELYRTVFPFGAAGKVQEEFSDDGRWTALAGYQSGSANRTIQAVDVKAGTRGAQMTVLDDAYNWARPTPDGKFLAVQWNAAADDLNGPLKTGVELYDIQSGVRVRKLAPAGHHGDWCVLPSGRVGYVTHHIAHPANGNYPAVVIYWCDGGPPTFLRMVVWGVLGHVSCRGPRGWALVSNQRPGGDVPNSPGEMWLMNLETGAVQRLGCARSTEGSYWTENDGVLTRDGRSVVFGSDWGGGAIGAFALEF